MSLCRLTRELQKNAELGVDLSAKYEIDTDFRELFVNHNHLFYYKAGDTIIIAEMFGEKEDFMYKLFGISGRTQESIDYWGESGRSGSPSKMEKNSDR